MYHVTFFAGLMLFCPWSVLQADDHSWSLDSTATSDFFSVHGDVTAGTGVAEHSAVLDGASLLKVHDSASITNGENGFTLTVWVNNKTVCDTTLCRSRPMDFRSTIMVAISISYVSVAQWLCEK